MSNTNTYNATVRVRLRPSILDPQGKAARHALHSLGFDSVDRIRIGKLIEMQVDAEDEERARSLVVASCEKLLANPVMEDYEIAIDPA